MTALYVVVIGLVLVVGLMGLLIVGLLRSHAEILRRLDSIGAGPDDVHSHGSTIELTQNPSGQRTVASAIQGITPEGEPVLISPDIGSDPTLLAFLSTSCASCTPFWEELDSSHLRFGGQRLRVLILTRGEHEESPTRTTSMRRGDADVVMSSTAWEDYGVPGAPFFVLVDPVEGVIGEGSTPTFEALAQFLNDSGNDRRWDREQNPADEVTRVDSDLRNAGILPGDPRLYHERGELPTDEEG